MTDTPNGYYATEEEAIAAAKEKAGGWVDDFSGKNCDECSGWDGESRRCECGNRRVYWETEQTPDGWRAYAQAW